MKFHIDDPDSASSNDDSGPTTSNSSNAVPSGSKKRYMIIDETKLPDDEAERLLAKRAYNRQSADRARKRSKATVKELLQQVEELYADKVELRRTLAAKKKEMISLEDSNKTLLLTSMTQVPNSYPPNNNIGLCLQLGCLSTQIHWNNRHSRYWMTSIPQDSSAPLSTFGITIDSYNLHHTAMKLLSANKSKLQKKIIDKYGWLSTVFYI